MRRLSGYRTHKNVPLTLLGFGFAVCLWAGSPTCALAQAPEPPPPVASPVPPVTMTDEGAGNRNADALGLEVDGRNLTAPDSGAAADTANDDFDPDASKIVHRSDDEMLLLEMRLGGEILADAMLGYLNGSSLLLPLRDVAEVLEFPIGVDPAAGTANGWFIQENKLFYLNVRRANVVVEGRQSTFDAGLVELHPDDIFVDIRLLSKWFPLDIRFEVSKLTVEVQSREPLAVERKLARDEYRKRMFGAKKQTQDLPEAIIPHKLADWPMLSLDTSTRLNKPRGASASFFTDYNLLSSADLGYANAELFVAGTSKDKVTGTRLKFERKDPNGKVFGESLGKTPITEMSVGDIYTPEIPLVARTQLGRGFKVSSKPLGSPTEFDKITLDGDLPIGWEVELYRNEVLIAFQASSVDGRYSFGDVPLLFGVNVVKLVFYGPQGQTREEIQQFRVGETLVKPGEVQFRVSGAQHDKRLLYKKRNTVKDVDGDMRMFGEAQLGISKNISIGANASIVPDESGQQRYVGLSAGTSLGDIYTRAEVTKRQGGGTAGRLSAQTSVAGVSVIGQHDRYYDYFSEYIASSGDPLTSVSKLRLDGSIPESVIPRIPFGITLEHSVRESKATETRLTNRMSQAIGPASVTNSLNVAYNRSADGSIDKSASGSLLVGGRIDAFRVRGLVGYSIAPLKEISSMSLSGDWSINKTYQGSANVTRTLGDTPGTAYSLGVNSSFDQLLAGLAFDYTSAREMVAKLTLNFSLTRDPNTGSIDMARGNIANKGAVASRVFLDNDDNGVFSDGDEPLEGIGFTANDAPLKGRTDKDGYAYVNGLEPYREMDLKVDVATLGDPYWIAHPGGVRMVPRPGTTGRFDFPIVSTGEIDGSVFRIWKEGPGSVSGVVVQLLKEDGTVVRELETAYDGFFLFDFVAPGLYTLRVSPEQLQSLELSVDTERTIQIDGGGTIVSGQDFVLK
ncbi:hypothetical protein [Magnetovibrio sp.]|uniref:hypothetical protein n=1 Tax=Magnetovibrio sp. TaxID=2024836 RepID=UPI002F94A93B